MNRWSWQELFVVQTRSVNGVQDLLYKDLLWKLVERPTRFIMAHSGIYFRLRIAEKKLEFFESALLLDKPTKQILEFIHHLQAISSSPYNFVRVGSANDGGYLLLNSFSNVGVCISLGIGTNIDFEQQILDKGIPVLAVDGTILQLPIKPEPNFKWINKNVGEADSELQISIDSLFALSADFFNWSGDCILKIDIEGSEYSAIKSLDIVNQGRASQIILELHNVVSMLYHSPSEIIELIEKILKTHELVHLHGNNYDFSVDIVGYTLPNVLELSFARRDLVEPSTERIEFPRNLDAPNNRLLPEIIIQS